MKQSATPERYTVDMSGVSWGNVAEFIAIVVAFYWSMQNNKRMVEQHGTQVQAMHNQNISKLSALEERLNITYDLLREVMRRQHPSGPHSAAKD